MIRPRAGETRSVKGARLTAGRRVAILAAGLMLLALPATAQAPVPPEGAVVVVVGVSDGMTVLPVASGTLPLRCEVAQ